MVAADMERQASGLPTVLHDDGAVQAEAVDGTAVFEHAAQLADVLVFGAKLERTVDDDDRLTLLSEHVDALRKQGLPYEIIREHLSQARKCLPRSSKFYLAE